MPRFTEGNHVDDPPLVRFPRRGSVVSRRLVVLHLAALLVVGCADAGSDPDLDAAPPGSECASVIDGTVEESADGTFRISATVSSVETGWDKYADEWRVLGEDGAVLGVRELLHPHVEEQPFTRSLTGVVIPADNEAVTLEARDSVLGYCGDQFVVAVSR